MRNGKKSVKNHEVTVHNEQTKNVISMVPDGGNIKSVIGPLCDSRALTNLALFFAQFDIDFDIHISSLLNKYEEKTRTMSENARNTFLVASTKGSCVWLRICTRSN